MRVLVISTWFPYPPDNGAKIRAYHLTRALSEKHDVTLVAFSPDAAAGVAQPGQVMVFPVRDDPFRHVSRSQILKYASPLPLAFWPSRRMRHMVHQIASACHFDAIVAIQTPVAQYAASLPNLPRIIDIDTSFSYQMEQRHEHNLGTSARLRTWLSWQKTHRYERRTFRKFQAFTVASSLEIDFIMKMLKDGINCVEVIPNGVDSARFRPGQYAIQPDTLIYNGALTYSANFDAMRYFLSAIYPLIQQRSPQVTLTITGSTTGVDQSHLQLDNSVSFSGYVEDIRPVVGGSTVCVVPIRQGSGTRLKILEAMALGVPVVSTRKGAEGLDVSDGQHLLLADDPAEFAAKTLMLLQDTTLRQRLASQARQLVEQHYEWRNIGQKFVELVEATVDKGSSRP